MHCDRAYEGDDLVLRNTLDNVLSNRKCKWGPFSIVVLENNRWSLWVVNKHSAPEQASATGII